jgi:uncharacterized protein (TIGR00661 family)
MKFFFFIQGEGRGHQTQAIALYELLRAAGHEVVGGIVGTTEGRGIAALLLDRLPFPLVEVPSPALLYSPTSKALAVGLTLRRNTRRIPAFLKHTARIDETVRQYGPDVIVNFYEMMCGIWQMRYRSPVPVVSVAHQYLLQHRDFRLPATRWLHRRIINTVTRLSALGTTRKLALSFYDFPDDAAADIYPVPPLLRPEVADLEVEHENFLLAYMTHYKLGQDLIDWHREYTQRVPEGVTIHAFWDHPAHADDWSPQPGLTFHRIHAARYLDAMRRCRGLVSTAGFESICEAMYLGKPALMIPVPGHFEQACNAFDAEAAGAGIQARSFADLNRFLTYLETQTLDYSAFRAWHAQTTERFLHHLSTVVG